jgi:hypothetical protein
MKKFSIRDMYSNLQQKDIRHFGSKQIISPTIAAAFLVLFVSQLGAMTASDKEKYESKGLSQIEWEMVLDARMPEKKVDELLKAGITITEYFRYPWLKMGISESEWIRSRRSGLLDSDIAAENRPHGSDPGGGTIMAAFLLPGMHQFRRQQYWKGGIMTGAAALAVALTAITSVHKGSFVPVPLLMLAPAMLWSSIDIGLQINKERNPDAARFSGVWDNNKNIAVSLYITSH